MQTKFGKQKILVTGGAGFVGQHLVAELKKNTAAKVVTLDVSPKADFQVDLAKFAVVNLALKKIRPDVVFHLAGFARTVGKKDLIMKINVKATENLLKALQNLKKPVKVLLASSGHIYGDINTKASERTKPSPLGDYAVSKFLMEEMAQKFLGGNLNIFFSRAFNQVGPGQVRGFVVSDICAQIAAIEKGQNEPVIQMGGLAAIRDFVDIRDAVKAYPLILNKGQDGEAYNICSGQGLTIKQILDKTLKLAKRKIKVKIDPQKATSSLKKLVGDPSKIEKLGWKRQIPLEKTLKDTLNWWRKK